MIPRRALGLALVFAAASPVSAIELVRTGKPVATIVVAPDASKPEAFAAQELQAIVATMSGARLPISDKMPARAEAVVLIGQKAAKLAGGDVLTASDANAARIEEDGYGLIMLTERRPRAIVIVSKEPRGTLYGVYDLLERFLNCGFFGDGDNIPKRPTVTVPDLASIVGNPAFRVRACYVPARFYAPKRFQATLWNPADWKAFLRWMAKKKLNTLAVPFTGATRAWGEAFDRALPEVKPFKRATLRPTGPGAAEGYSIRMGWGLSPKHTTAVWREAITYARETLGFDTLYILGYGEFEEPLQRAHPRGQWLPTTRTRDSIGCAGENRWLSPIDTKFNEFQTRLWQSIIRTYGNANHYLVLGQPPQGAGRPTTGSAYPAAAEILTKLDPKGHLLISTAEYPSWGETPNDQMAFIAKLAKNVTMLYVNTGTPTTTPLRVAIGDVRLRTSLGGAGRDQRDDRRNLELEAELFGGRPYWYACIWSNSPANDLFENIFRPLYTHALHLRQARPPKPPGYCNWNTIRGVNPAMDSLSAGFAWLGDNMWRGGAAANNRHMRLYLSRRYTPAAAFPMGEAFKQAIRGAPPASAPANYRAYARWAATTVEGVSAARAGVALALGARDAAQGSPFYEADLADWGRNYCHQYIYARYYDILALVQQAKRAAASGAYPADAKTRSLAQLKDLGSKVRLAHKSLIRLLATRRDMSLDDAILEAIATADVNPRLALAIREHQSGAYADAACLTDSLEYHSQLKSGQIDFFLQYATKEVTTPTNAPIPEWKQFFLHGVAEFVKDSKPAAYEQKTEKDPASKILADLLGAVE